METGETEPVRKLTFARLRAVNQRRCVEGFGHKLGDWSAAEWTNAICGEVGEAAEALLALTSVAGNAANTAKKILRYRDGVAGNRSHETLVYLKRKLAKELADVAIYTDLAAAAIGEQLDDAIIEVFNTKSDEIGSKEKL